jgi:hypothetical protein
MVAEQAQKEDVARIPLHTNPKKALLPLLSFFVRNAQLVHPSSKGAGINAKAIFTTVLIILTYQVPPRTLWGIMWGIPSSVMFHEYYCGGNDLHIEIKEKPCQKIKG